MPRLTPLEQLDLHSRAEWVRACTAALITSQPRSVIAAIVAGGFREFLRVAKPIWDVHVFQFDDYKQAFSFLELFLDGHVTPQSLLDRGNLTGVVRRTVH